MRDQGWLTRPDVSHADREMFDELLFALFDTPHNSTEATAAFARLEAYEQYLREKYS